MKKAFFKKMAAAIAVVTAAASAATNPVAASAATNTAASAAEIVLGDLTGDGVVDVFDAVKVSEIIAGELVGLESGKELGAMLEAGDVDGDGAISINDLVYIMTKIEREELLGEQHYYFPVESPHPYGVWYTCSAELVMHQEIWGDEYACIDAGGIAFLEIGEEFTITEYCGDAWYLVHTNNLRKAMYVQIPETVFSYLCKPSPMG